MTVNELNALSERQQSLMRHLLYADGLTLTQLTEKLNISRNAATQHVTNLENWRLIESKMLQSEGGRPSRSFVLTEAGKALFPKQYSLFSLLLLQSIGASMPKADLEKMLATIGQNLASSFQERVDSSGNPVEEVRMIMCELGYETTTASEQEQNSSEIIAKNCVFHDLAIENQSVCQLDVTLISSLLGAPIEQKACMALGDNSCTFCVEKT